MACDGETVRVGEEESAVAMNDEKHRTSSNENADATSDEEQPDSNNENESAKMHRYMAAGSFASRELLRQTYDQFFDHQFDCRDSMGSNILSWVHHTFLPFFFRKISSPEQQNVLSTNFSFFSSSGRLCQSLH